MAAYDRLPNETAKAYAAFHAYMLLPTRDRSIDTAYQQATNRQGTGNHAPGQWTKWSTQYDWVRRAAAYDEHLTEQDRLLWEERRKQMREREWARGDALHDLVARALPYAEQFIHRRATEINGQIVITLSFDVIGLSKVSLDASKLQRLASDEPTEYSKLSGAALDALLARELARIRDGGQTGGAGEVDALPSDFDDAPTP